MWQKALWYVCREPNDVSFDGNENPLHPVGTEKTTQKSKFFIFKIYFLSIFSKMSNGPTCRLGTFRGHLVTYLSRVVRTPYTPSEGCNFELSILASRNMTSFGARFSPKLSNGPTCRSRRFIGYLVTYLSRVVRTPYTPSEERVEIMNFI